jgi:hypothetical protein
LTTAGIEVKNNSGIVQITQDFYNFQLLATGSLTTAHDAAFSASSVESASVTVTGANPLCAFSCSALVTLGRVSNSGSSFTFYFLTPGSTHQTINYWIFDSANQVTVSDTFGLAIYRADASLAFHSSSKSMRVVDFYALSLPATTSSINDQEDISSWGPHTSTYTAGRTYAVVQSIMFRRTEKYNSIASYGPLAPGHKWMENSNMRGGASVSTNTVTFDINLLEQFHTDELNATAETYTQWGSLKWLVVDVTNY